MRSRNRNNNRITDAYTHNLCIANAKGNIIHRWAPPEDNNDTTTYLRTVIRLLDYKVAGRQPLPSPACREGHRVFARILAAMTCVECGIALNEVNKQEIEKGWVMAF